MKRCSALSLVMPAYNEEANVGAAIRACAAAGEKFAEDYEVIVVDDGSRDRTADCVREEAQANPRVRLISLPQNRGFGGALKTGLKAAGKALVFYTDSDLQFDLQEIDGLLDKIDACPVVVGYRVNRQDHFVRKLNAWAWGRLQWVLFGLDVRDIDCGFKLFRREVLQAMPMRSDGAFISTEILLRARAAGHRICEVPVRHYPRKAGAPTGANLSVIRKAFRELWALRKELR
ncbi:MAG TPA: glycosyltransferase family 2 protein [Candidatus Binatia bacterium]|nr:glycosyltransferase family 2 protein [Candidatus Binatia bacterium]